jgi:hypothetical protein
LNLLEVLGPTSRLEQLSALVCQWALVDLTLVTLPFAMTWSAQCQEDLLEYPLMPMAHLHTA